MTPEAQRIAIAEACGWEFHQDANLKRGLLGMGKLAPLPWENENTTDQG
jgi:hypothetical protein